MGERGTSVVLVAGALRFDCAANTSEETHDPASWVWRSRRYTDRHTDY